MILLHVGFFVFMVALSATIFSILAKFHDPRKGRDLGWVLKKPSLVFYPLVGAGLAKLIGVYILFGIATGAAVVLLGPLAGLIYAAMTSKNGVK